MSEFEIKVVLNEEKNGVELYFNDKPCQKIRNNLKSSGFKWSRFNECWFAKQSDKTVAFANSLANTTTEEIKEKSEEYKEQKQEDLRKKLMEIDIEDIENYIVPAEISKRENENSFFRRTERNHTKVLQDEFIEANETVIDILKNTNSLEIEYYLKLALQRFKKNYTEAYIKYLNHKGDNPSWVVTGRSGRNATRDRKNNARQDKLLQNLFDTKNRFKEICDKNRSNIRKEKRLRERKEFEEGTKDITIPEFKRIKKNINPSATNKIFDGNTTFIITMHTYNDYFIAKNWGAWRVYNQNGVELYSTKTNETLLEAKKWLIYQINKLEQGAI
ncbi:hypothetical protein NYR90_11565 [Clostridioides difficile]|nr:hypothetical protein NYR90_11565 [Clostridioides difficile]